MTDTVNFPAAFVRGDFLGHALIAALSSNLTDDEMDAHISKHHKRLAESKSKSVPIEVTLIIDGKVCPLRETMDDWNKQMDRMILERAHSLLEEKHRALVDKLDAVGRAIDEAFPGMGEED